MTSSKEDGRQNRVMGLSDPDVFGDEEQAWGMEKNLDWRLAWQRAVAKAWAYPAYRAKLLEQPAVALREVGWQVPAGLELKVEAAPGSFEWDPKVHEGSWGSTSEHLAVNGWAARVGADGQLKDRRAEVLKALKTTVVLRLPPKPADDALAALAVSDYDGLSRAYPFTCAVCC